MMSHQSENGLKPSLVLLSLIVSDNSQVRSSLLLSTPGSEYFLTQESSLQAHLYQKPANKYFSPFAFV